MKTTQQRLIVLLAAVGVLAVLGAAWVARARDDAMTVEHRIRALAAQRRHTGEDVTFSMADVTPFEWDAMHVFGPYTAERDINRALGFTWSGANGVQSELGNDGICYLVFVHDGSVVCDLSYNRGYGDFGDLEGTAYRFDAAYFVFTPDRPDRNGEQWLVVRPDNKPNRGTEATP